MSLCLRHYLNSLSLIPKVCPPALIASVKDRKLIAFNILRRFSISRSLKNPNVPFSAENVYHPLGIHQILWECPAHDLNINVKVVHVSKEAEI